MAEKGLVRPQAAWSAPGPPSRTAGLALAAAVLSLGWAVSRGGPPPGAETSALDPVSPGETHVLYIDLAGWYGRTPDEVAVVSPYDLTLDGLPAGLPRRIGAWTSTDREADPAIERWFDHPEVAMERTYRRSDGATVWVSAFGSRGPKSFHLFEHTPVTCYPLSGWAIGSLDARTIPLGPRPLTVNFGRAASPEGRLAFLFVYVWRSPARDADEGVVSLRLAAPLVGNMTYEDAEALLTDDFVPLIFTTTVAWSAF